MEIIIPDKIKIEWLAKTGEKVWVCYDGKGSRRVPGKVVFSLGLFILCRFKEWAKGEEIITAWFPIIYYHDKDYKKHGKRVDTFIYKSYGKFVKVKHSLMKLLFGASGDWYSVVSLSTSAESVLRGWDGYAFTEEEWNLRNE